MSRALRCFRTRASALLAITALLAIAACGGSEADGEAGGEDGGDAVELTKIRVAMNWITPSAAADIYMVAQEHGYYEEAGLEVEFIWLRGSNLAAQAVGVGQADIADVDASAILIALSQGIGMTVVAAPLQNTPMGVITLQANNITSIEDLKGKTVSTSAAGPDAAVLQGLLKQKGLEGEVELSYVDPTAKCTVMVAGNSHACTGQNTGHVGQVEATGNPALFIPFSTDAQPLPGTSIVANNNFLRHQPETVAKFLAATYRGAQEAGKDVDASIELMQRLRKEAGGSDADLAGMVTGVKNAHTLWRSRYTDEHGWGWIDPAAWSTLQDMLFDADILQNKIDTSEIYSNDSLPENATDF
jgi:NitT/TauT family transport system substrate-binding protein